MASLVVIGNFDGVHRGHRTVLEGALREAETRGLDTVLLTFHPHPAEVLGRSRPPLLTDQARKRELVARVSPRILFREQAFDRAFAAQTPRAFAERLKADLDARYVVVGQNFRFGQGRAGDFATLTELGQELGFEARAQTLAGDERGPWSSTRTRGALERGDLAEASLVLGRPHAWRGRVTTGKKLGRTIGFPTANLVEVAEASVPFGVYAVLVDRLGPEGARALGLGAMSVGVNPTTDSDDAIKREVYVLDWSGDLYGADLRVHLVERLRGEQRFEDLPALVAQIQRDVDETRARLGAVRPDPSTSAFG